MTHYTSNPKRGCGRKKAGGFYGEGGFSRGGMLDVWTHVYGDGFSGGNNCIINVPPRTPVFANQASTMLLSQIIGHAVQHPLYNSLVKRAGGSALFDHVGKSQYTPHSFYLECRKYGPSRRFAPQTAMQLVKKVPIPVFFTHSLVPIFRSKKDVYDIQEIIDKIFVDQRERGAVWHREDWGIWVKYWKGESHYMHGVFRLMQMIKNDSKEVDSDLDDARNFFEKRRPFFAEQIFGASWVTRIGYVPKDDDDDGYLKSVQETGIEILDISDESNEEGEWND